MKELEERLRELELRAPSPDLDRRILALEPNAKPAGFRYVRLEWAFAFALILGIVGFSVGLNVDRIHRAEMHAPEKEPVRVIYMLDSSKNPFDLSNSGQTIQSPKWEIKSIKVGGKEI